MSDVVIATINNMARANSGACSSLRPGGRARSVITLSSSLHLVKFPSSTANSKLSVKNDPHNISTMKNRYPRTGKVQSVT